MRKFLFLSLSLIFLLTSCEVESPNLSETAAPEEFEGELKAPSKWSTVFFDGFNSGSNINDKWNRTDRKDYNSQICNYKPGNVGLATLDRKQCLRLTARKYRNQYRSGHVKSKFRYAPKRNEEYRIRASIKLVARSGNAFKGFGQTYGAWPAFWTVEEDRWPTRGEIDIMEGYSYSPDAPHFSSNLFYGDKERVNILDHNSEQELTVSEGWHTYEMRWRNNAGTVTLQIFLDGTRQRTYTNKLKNVKLQNFGPHNIILNLNVGSDASFGIFDNSKINLFSNTFMYVDFVRVERRTL